MGAIAKRALREFWSMAGHEDAEAREVGPDSQGGFILFV